MTIQQDRQKHSIRHQHRRKIEPEGENRPRYLAKSIDNPKAGRAPTIPPQPATSHTQESIQAKTCRPNLPVSTKSQET